jgi:hypothetical protein
MNTTQMPELITSRLTFGVVTSVLDRLLAQSWDLKLECLVLAALLSAETEEDETVQVETGPVETGPGDGTAPETDIAADITIWRRSLLQELFLITQEESLPATVVRAARLREKTDLPRVHVLTSTDADLDDIYGCVGLGYDQDVSVLDIHHEIQSAIARLARQSRRVALHKLYRYLRTKQPGPGLAAEYVNTLDSIRPDIIRRSGAGFA